MIAGTKYYVSVIEQIINQDRQSFMVDRIIKSDDGYGGVVENHITFTIDGRIYNRRSVREIQEIKGVSLGFSQVATEKLLVLSSVDIIKGDTFKYLDRTLRVKFVNDYFGICKQCELEVIEDE